MVYPYLHFLNLEYWYCVVISLFGAHCATTEFSAGGALPAGGVSASTTPIASGSAHASGFFGWLFGAGANGSSSGLAPFFGVVSTIAGALWTFTSFVVLVFSFLLFVLIAASLVGIFVIRLGEHERHGNLPPEAAHPHPLRAHWQELLEGAMSPDPKRWREAIFGADRLLGDLFARLGYAGETTAERMTAVPDGAFANLPAAWEAHRIRNFVSAPKSHFILTQREAFRVMKLYEQVFKEFDFI